MRTPVIERCDSSIFVTKEDDVFTEAAECLRSTTPHLF
jgi:hypothetical protein